MEIQLKEYDPVPIPEVTEGEPFWLLALGNLTRHNSKVFQLDDSKYEAYETWIKENVKDKDYSPAKSGYCICDQTWAGNFDR